MEENMDEMEELLEYIIWVHFIEIADNWSNKSFEELIDFLNITFGSIRVALPKSY